MDDSGPSRSAGGTRSIGLCLVAGLLLAACTPATAPEPGPGDGGGPPASPASGSTDSSADSSTALSTASSTSPSVLTPVDVPVRNFAKVDDGFWRGAQPDEAGFRALGDLGVKTVVTLREHHDDDPEDVPDGIDLVAIRMRASLESDPPTDEDVRRFFEVVLDPARRPVFVHCAKGKDRTGTMCALYRIEKHGWTAADAFAEMQRFGYHDVYRDLGRFVRGYTARGFAKTPR